VPQPAPADDRQAVPPSSGAIRPWLSPRRKRFWLLVLLLMYTLGGFFLVPVLVKSQIITTAREDLGREVTIERVRFNPYVLSMEIEGFSLNDPDGVTMAGFDRFVVNLQLSSLFRWAWTFREVSLDGLDLQLERFAPGDSRLNRLLAEQEARSEPSPPASESSGELPRLLIHDLTLNSGRIRFSDHVPENPVELEFGPVTVSVNELNTLPDRTGQQAVNVMLPEGARIGWQGSLDLNPLQSAGTLTVEGSQLAQTIAYLESVLPLSAMRATLSLQTQYRIDEKADGSLAVELDSLDASLSDVAVSGLEPDTEFIAFPSLQLLGGKLRYPESTAGFAEIRLTEPRLEAWLDENGEPNLLQLLPVEPSATEEPQADTADASAWRLAVDEFAITGGRIGFTDRRTDPLAVLAFEDIELTVSEISNDEGAIIPTSLAASLAPGGSLGFEGKLTALPEFTATGTATAAGISLALLQPWVQQQVNIQIRGGALETSTELKLLQGGELEASGRVAVSDLRVDNPLDEQPLIGWARLDIDRFEAATASSTVDLSLVTFEQPFGRLIINEDLTTNLSDLIVQTADEAATTDAIATETEADESASYTAVIGGIVVRDGGLDFADRSLPLPFATKIRGLKGTISTVDTSSTEPTNIRLEGQVDEYGLARIDGAMNLLDTLINTDVTMEFRNLLMSNLSPYSIEFAGRAIDEGKLNLDLVYRIQDGQMLGENTIVMSDLVLGDKVESENAVSLPLGLAVALLTDANGVIDLDLPVEGDVNDPEFRLGGVIWKAITGLITKVVSAPFRLLGSLIGVESEDLGQFQFLAGRADLTPPELEKISQLQQALLQRPELAIEVGAVFDPAIDVPALQYQQLRSVVLERLGEDYANPDEEFSMLSDEIRALFESLFAERFPDTPLESVKAAHMAPPADDPEGEPVLDKLAYTGDLRDRLLAAEPVGQQELENLASARAQAVRDAFMASGEFDETRIVIAAPAAVESEDTEWVVMELGVVAD
jgi:hypothetical protein